MRLVSDKYLEGYMWEQYVLTSQLVQLFYLFYLQQSEYDRSSSINSPKYLIFMSKKLIRGSCHSWVFGMDENLQSLTF